MKISRGSAARRIAGVALLLLPYLFALLVCEVGLRLYGYNPIVEYRTGGVGGEYAADPLTGWRLAERSSSGDSAVTVWPGGRRATSLVDPWRYRNSTLSDSGKPHLVFLGGSFTQGEGLSDQDSFPWIVQEKLSDVQVLNFGTGGYGGCQSLLRMRELIQEKGLSGATYVYGFYSAHESRNIADPVFAWKIARISNYRSAFMPYCWVDESGALIFKPPEKFDFEVPWSDRLATSCLLEEGYYHFKAIERRKRQREVSELILLAMNELAEESGGRFIVLSMRFDEEMSAHFRQFFKKHKIEFVDGSHPQQNDSSMQLPDKHPNAEMSRYWAAKLLSYFESTGISSERSDRISP